MVRGLNKLLIMLCVLMCMMFIAMPTYAEESDTYYTVRYDYQGEQYVMKGGSTVKLDDILKGIGILGEVESVEGSNDMLFSFEKRNGEWYVVSHKAFASAEWMDITVNGNTYRIPISDSSYSSVSSNAVYTSGSFTLKLVSDYTNSYTITTGWSSKPSSWDVYNSGTRYITFSKSGSGSGKATLGSVSNAYTTTSIVGKTQAHGYYQYIGIPCSIYCPFGYDYYSSSFDVPTISGHTALYAVSASTSSETTPSWSGGSGGTKTIYVCNNVAHLGLVTIDWGSDGKWKISNCSATITFKPNNYYVYFDANGGFGAPSTKTATFDSTFTIPTTKPTSGSKTFKGWAAGTTASEARTRANNGYVDRQPGASWTWALNSNYYLAAVWDESYTLSATAVTRNAAGTSSTISTTGGYTSPTSQSVTGGSTGTMRAYSYSGYTFKGWATSSTSTSYVSTSSSYSPTVNSNITYYAIFQALPTYTVTGTAVWRYEPGNSPSLTYEETTAGTVTYTSQEVSSGSSAYLSASAKTGYQFLGWATSKTATSYSSTSTTYYPTIYSNSTYYGIFCGRQYTATFNLNGGNISGSTSNVTRKYYYNSDDNSLNGGTDLGSSVKVTDIPQKSGYTFTGYYTSSSGGTKIINADGTIVRDGTYFAASTKYPSYSAWVYTGNQTFYAQYVVSNYTVTASAVTRNEDGSTSTVSTTGGTVNPTTQDVSPGGTATITATAASGYTFKGWGTSKDQTNDLVQSNPYSLTVSSDKNLYAIFQKNDTTSPVATISSANTNVGGGQSQYIDIAQNVTLSGTDNVGIIGYYWGTNSNPSSYTSVTSNKNWSNTLIVSSPGTYYLFVKDAVGNTNSKSITFYKTTFSVTNGKVLADSVRTMRWAVTKAGDSFNAPEITPDTGFISPGEWTYDTGTVGEGESYTPDTNRELTAICTLPNYTITYYANGGSGAPESQTLTGGTVATISQTEPTKTDYAFIGWATSQTDADNGVVSYRPGDSYSDGVDLDLYAVWALAYIVRYNPNGGTPNTQYTSNHAYGIEGHLRENTYTKKQYYLQGWATSEARANAGTVDFTDGQVVTQVTPASATPGAVIDLYAVWGLAVKVTDNELGTVDPDTGSDKQFTIINPTEASTTITFTKKSSAGANLQGITFYLSGRSATGKLFVNVPATSNENGTVTYTGILEGEYTITEDSESVLANQPGIIPADDSWTLDVARDGNEFSYTIKKGTVTLANNIIINPNESTNNFEFYKYGNDTNETLQGVEFTLTGTSNYGTTVNETEVSGSDGKVSFTDIPYGVYQMEESGNGSTITIGGVERDRNDYGWEVTVGATITIKDKRSERVVTEIYNPTTTLEVSFTKQDSEDLPLGGVDFLLVGAKAAGGQYNATATSNSFGKVEFSEVPEGVYTLEEVSVENATRSVIKSEDTWEVKVTKDPNTNVLTYNIKKNGEDSNITTITNQLEPYRTVEFYKLNDSGGKLDGAVFRLTGVSDIGTEVDKTAISGEGGTRGFVQFTDVYYGTYTLNETTPPNGFKPITETFTATVDSNGVTIRNSNGRKLEVVSGDSVIRNTPYETDIRLIKRDVESERLLNGAVYLIEGESNAGVTISQEALSGDEDTDGDGVREDGLMVFHNIPIGTYTLTETTAPRGYKEDANTYDVVVTQSNVTITLDGTPLEKLEDDFIVTDTKINPLVGKFIIKKVDKDLDPIGGVEFTLSGVSNDDEVINFVKKSDPDTGIIVFNDIPQGVYELQETATPAFYDGDFEIHEIEVLGTTVTMRDARQNVVKTWTKDDESYYTVVNPYKIRGGEGIIIRKKDAETGAMMSDVRFTIVGTQEDGMTVDFTDKTNDEGEVIFDNINYGTYTLTENAVENYYMISPLEIVVNNSGITVTQDGDDITATASREVAGRVYGIYEFDDQPYQDLKIRKVDTEQHNLQGAKFRLVEADYLESLYDVLFDGTNFMVYDTGTENLTSDEVSLTLKQDDGTVFATGGIIPASAFDIDPEDGDSMTLSANGKDARFKIVLDEKVTVSVEKTDIFSQIRMTNYNGVLTFDNIPEGEYLLMETQAPTGFFRTPTIYNVTVTRTDAVVEDVEKYGDAYEIENPTLKTNINIRKQNSAGTTLSGAVYQIVGMTIQNKPFSRTTEPTDNNGIVSVTDIPAGSYTITEVTPPDNYMLGTEEYALDISFDEDLQEFTYKCVSDVKGRVSGIDIGGVMTFPYTNYQYPDLKIRKVDESGVPLEGATFTVKNAVGNVEYTSLTTNGNGYVTFKGLADYGTDLSIYETESPHGYARCNDVWHITIDTTKAQPYTVQRQIKTYTGFATCEHDNIIEDEHVSICYETMTYECGDCNDEIICDICKDCGAIKPTEVIRVCGDCCGNDPSIWNDDLDTWMNPTSITDWDYYKYDITPTAVGDAYGFEVRNIKLYYPLKIRKVSSVMGNPISGAKFELVPITDDGPGEPIESVTPASGITGNDGYITWTGLAVGEYQLNELETPDGYLSNNNSWDVLIEEPTSSSESPAKVYCDGEEVAATKQGNEFYTNIENTPGYPIKIRKLRSDTNEPIVGASLYIYTPEDAYVEDITSATTPQTVTLAPGTYELRESNAPMGYVTAEPIPFTISNSGELSSTEQGAVEGDTITMYDDVYVGDIVINKTDGTNPLAGATFSLSGQSETGKIISKTAVSQADGTVTFSDIELGYYTFIETASPNAIIYAKDETSYIAEVYLEDEEVKTHVRKVSGEVIDTIENTILQTYSDLTVTKNVVGSLGDRTKEFSLTLSAVTKYPNATYVVMKNGVSAGTVTATSSGAISYDFTLKDDDVIVFKDMPDDMDGTTSFSVREAANNHRATYTTDSGKSGGNTVSNRAMTTETLKFGTDKSVAVTNERNIATNTGTVANSVNIFLLALIIIAQAAIFTKVIQKTQIFGKKKQ